jgi:dGTP triphosphohydrolase
MASVFCETRLLKSIEVCSISRYCVAEIMKHKKEGKEKNKKRKIVIKKYQENTGEGKHQVTDSRLRRMMHS